MAPPPPRDISSRAGSVGRDQGIRRSPYGRIGAYAARILLAVFFAFPIIFMFVSSLKPDDQIFADLSSVKAFLPTGHISFANYTGVFKTAPAGRFLLNSILITA